jgi:hypothetical protein
MTDSGQTGLSRRIRRELKTVRVMIELYCRAHHEADAGGLCSECRELWDYARQRVERCPFGLDKPTCLNCTVHCYKPRRREQIREVMRFAGPRMSWRHPVLTIFHFIDGRRQPPPRAGRTTSTKTR